MRRRRKEVLPLVRCKVSIWQRIATALWTFTTGVLAGVSLGWLSEAPWLAHRLSQLFSWLTAFHISLQ